MSMETTKLTKCTNCGSQNTKLVSQFGSTACKALFKCEDCHEPFDYFKCLKWQLVVTLSITEIKIYFDWK